MDAPAGGAGGLAFAVEPDEEAARARAEESEVSLNGLSSSACWAVAPLLSSHGAAAARWRCSRQLHDRGLSGHPAGAPPPPAALWPAACKLS